MHLFNKYSVEANYRPQSLLEAEDLEWANAKEFQPLIELEFFQREPNSSK